MPVLKIKHVVSCSSEDEKHPADNMIKPETYYKWRCASGSDANATIVLQLEKATQISGVDIGNNGSAFIEVLVGRSSWSQSEEFQVLLLASSFMTPADSKAGKEISRVRMFGLEHLNKPVAADKWDQVKIVCTQPYNQNEPYGLSFVKLYTPVDESEKAKEKSLNLGRFKLKFDDDDELPTLSSGSFFQKRMNIPVEPNVIPKMSMAASARSSDPSPRANTIFKTKVDEAACAKKISLSEDRRQEVASALFQGAENKPQKVNTYMKFNLPMSDTKKNNEVAKRKIENESKPQHVSATPPPNKKLKDTSPPHVSKASPSTKKHKDLPKHTKVKIKKKNVTYGKILEGVIFVLSGYQNPVRGNIRDVALSMGAKYEPSWNDRCTHLICAFANTPKFREVVGKGKIVRKHWIDECDKKNRRLNTKDYRLDGGGESSFESSGSDDENVGLTNSVKNTEVTHQKENQDEKKSSSECDTEDEIEKIRMLEKEELEKENSTVPLCSQNKLDTVDDEYGASTDEGDTKDASDGGQIQTNEVSDSPSTKSFFENKLFFIYGDFDVKDSRLLKRYITDHSGSVADYMNESVHFVISKESWDPNFQQELHDNPYLTFVQPKWIFKCHEKQEYVPYDNYEIKP